MGYTHPRLYPNRNKSCAPSTAVYVAALSESDYIKFQMTRSHYIYIGPPISSCAVVIDISGRINTVYVVCCKSSHVCTVLTHVLKVYVSWSLDCCQQCQSLTVSISSVLLLTRSSAIAVDVVVVVLTWIKIYGHWRHMRQLHINVSVTETLIRDGMISFPT